MGTTENDLSTNPINPVSNESCHEPEEDEIEDALDEVEELPSLESEVLKSTDIVQSSVTMGTTENDLSTDPINPVSNESCHEPEKDEIEDVSEYKPKWEINYDAIYAAQDDEVDDGEDEVEDLAPIESDVPKSTDTVQSSGTVCTNEDTANTVSLELNDSDLLGDTKMADIDRNLSAE